MRRPRPRPHVPCGRWTVGAAAPSRGDFNRGNLRRVAQFFRALAARVHADELDRVRERLGPAQAGLFLRMSPSDQRHCLNVYHTLVRAGYDQEDLLRAALLHDVGKAAPAGGPDARRMTVLHRVAIVLLQGFKLWDTGPRWLARLAADGRGWKAPFAVHARHAQVGAAWAADVGCSPAVVALIRGHHGGGAGCGEPNENLDVLRWADEQN